MNLFIVFFSGYLCSCRSFALLLLLYILDMGESEYDVNKSNII